MAQYARPSVDGGKLGDWVPSPSGNRWDKLDESSPDDLVSYVLNDGASVGDYFDQELSSVEDPGYELGHVLRFRLAKIGGSQQFSAIICLFNGNPANGNFVAVCDTLTIIENSTYKDSAYVLTGAEGDSIHDYSDLWIRVQITAVSGSGSAPQAVCTWAALEVPDVGDRRVIGWRAWYKPVDNDTDSPLRAFNSNDDAWDDLPDTGMLVVLLYEQGFWNEGGGKHYRRILVSMDWYCLNSTSGNWSFVPTHTEWGQWVPEPVHPHLVCKRGDAASDADFENAQAAAMAAGVL